MPAYGLFARHVRDLELAAVRFSFEQEDQRPPIVCIDVEGLEIDNLKATVAKGIAPARWEEVKNLVIRNSPLLESSAAK